MGGYFPNGYLDSRHKFLELARRAERPSEIGRWTVPSRTESDLSVDHVYFPALERNDTLFVISSGIHGLEAYTGAAIQGLFLDQVLGRIDRRHIGVFVVHAMNPYGFKHHRRSTENHVNLNRNFSIHPDLYRIQNRESAALQERFVPRQAVDSLTSFLMRNSRVDGERVSFLDVPMDTFVKSVCAGQFECADNLEFGGFGPEPQSAAFMEWLKQTMPDYRDIVLLDLHTGLGHSGRLHLLTSGAPEEVNEDLFNELFDLEKDREIYEFTPATAEGFYPTHGSLNCVFPEIARSGQRVAAITMEFGTLGHDLKARLEGFNRWLIEHQGIHYGFKNRELEEVSRAQYLEKFFPKDETWRKSVLAAAEALFTRVFQRASLDQNARSS